MARSSQTERVLRINAAHQLLQDNLTAAAAADVLSDRFSVGKRQAYRYIEEAYQASTALEVPEPKEVFTVKLPISLIDQLRNHPRPSGQTLSDFVCNILRRILEEEQNLRRGRSQQ